MKYLDKVLLLIEEIKARNSQREELAGDEVEDLEEAEEFGEYFRDPNDYQDDDPFFDDDWDEDEDLEDEVGDDGNDGDVIDITAMEGSLVKPEILSGGLTTADRLPRQSAPAAAATAPIRTVKDEAIGPDQFGNRWSEDELAFLETRVRVKQCDENYLRINWAKQQAMEIYLDLTYQLDQKLRRGGSSLEKLHHRGRNSQLGIYTTLYIYVAAVLPKIFFNNYGWQIYKARLELLGNFTPLDPEWILNYCSAWIEHYQILPDAETCRSYHYTQNGHPIVWWDPEGLIRGDGLVTAVDQHYLNKLPKRKSIYLENEDIRTEVVWLFVALCRIIIAELEDPKKKWPAGMKMKLKRLFLPDEHGSGRYSATALQILTELFRISENEVRVKLFNNKALDVSRDLLAIQMKLRETCVEAIHETLAAYTGERLGLAAVLRIVDYNESFHMLLVRSLQGAEPEAVFAILQSCRGKAFETKVIGKALEGEADPVKYLIYSLTLAAEGSLKKGIRNKARELVHPTRHQVFDQMLASGQRPVSEDLPGITQLPSVLRKDIQLDFQKIHVSRQELQAVIENVQAYTDKAPGETQPAAPSVIMTGSTQPGRGKTSPVAGASPIIASTMARPVPDSAESARQTSLDSVRQTPLNPARQTPWDSTEPMAEIVTGLDRTQSSENLENISAANENKVPLTAQQLKLTRLSLSGEGLGVAEARSIAEANGSFLNAFIGGINEALFALFQDQVLLMDDVLVTVDEYYKDDLMEIINGA